MEQLAARRAHNPKVVGSSPAPATIKRFYIYYRIFFIYELYLSLTSQFKLSGINDIIVMLCIVI